MWITNKLGNSERGRLKMAEMAVAGKVNFYGDPDATARLTRLMVTAMYGQKPGKEGGSMTVLHPDGTEASFSPVYGKGIYGPWAVSIDGNDNVWIANFASELAGVVELCGFRAENCPPGHEDRGCDLAARRLCGRRFAIAGRCRHRSGWRCVRHQQLANHCCVLRQGARGHFHPLRRPGLGCLLRPGQASAHAPDWAAATTVTRSRVASGYREGELEAAIVEHSFRRILNAQELPLAAGGNGVRWQPLRFVNQHGHVES